MGEVAARVDMVLFSASMFETSAPVDVAEAADPVVELSVAVGDVTGLAFRDEVRHC